MDACDQKGQSNRFATDPPSPPSAPSLVQPAPPPPRSVPLCVRPPTQPTDSNPSHDPTPPNFDASSRPAALVGPLSNLRRSTDPKNMMMTAAPTDLLHTPKLSASMGSLSVKRPSLSPLKRKLSEDDTTSPTSTDEVPANSDESVISPKKKAKLSTDATWTGALVLDELVTEDGSDEACMKVLAAYTPVAFTEEPAEPLDEEELKILSHFLS